MERSRLPLQCLLCLFGALLLLSPAVLQDMPEGLSDVPLTSSGVRKAVAFAVERYNRDKEDSTNYFKKVNVLKAQSPADNKDEYHLKVELVKTRCEKKPGSTKTYRGIQRCKPLGDNENASCYFKVTPGSEPNQKNLEITACT